MSRGISVGQPVSPNSLDSGRCPPAASMRRSVIRAVAHHSSGLDEVFSLGPQVLPCVALSARRKQLALSSSP
ncbi:hypothetical protein GCM10007857_89160 [Bradyrhizobium iriomotense]|uniref:Uncharacterized protein n=1 Tax=Bradyrhizobium iriomotense TaxID=441950 RepID=A0ABQ6BHZ2_9BRAD|nr:hypothetical protein GCM10007857_89160 [Bradyrhizobium iriomotense]